MYIFYLLHSILKFNVNRTLELWIDQVSRLKGIQYLQIYKNIINILYFNELSLFLILLKTLEYIGNILQVFS